MASFYLTHLFKGPISKHSRLLVSWALGLPHVKCGETEIIPCPWQNWVGKSALFSRMGSKAGLCWSLTVHSPCRGRSPYPTVPAIRQAPEEPGQQSHVQTLGHTPGCGCQQFRSYQGEPAAQPGAWGSHRPSHQWRAGGQRTCGRLSLCSASHRER